MGFLYIISLLFPLCGIGYTPDRPPMVAASIRISPKTTISETAGRRNLHAPRTGILAHYNPLYRTYEIKIL